MDIVRFWRLTSFVVVVTITTFLSTFPSKDVLIHLFIRHSLVTLIHLRMYAYFWYVESLMKKYLRCLNLNWNSLLCDQKQSKPKQKNNVNCKITIYDVFKCVFTCSTAWIPGISYEIFRIKAQFFFSNVVILNLL
jgi:hypothetical protein